MREELSRYGHQLGASIGTRSADFNQRVDVLRHRHDGKALGRLDAGLWDFKQRGRVAFAFSETTPGRGRL